MRTKTTILTTLAIAARGVRRRASRRLVCLPWLMLTRRPPREPSRTRSPRSPMGRPRTRLRPWTAASMTGPRRTRGRPTTTRH
jgi:hypothetical protein